MNLDPSTVTLLKFLGLLALVCLNGFFVAAEFALVRLRDTQLEALVARGHRRARIARRLVQNVEACLSVTQMGITLCGLGLGAVAAPVFEGILAPVFQLTHLESAGARKTVAILVGFFINTVLLIVVGELVPKALAIRRTLATSLWIAPPLEWFYRLTFPFIWVLNHAAQWLLGQLGIHAASAAEQSHSEEELRLMLSSAQQRAGGTKLGRDIVLNALSLRHRIVRDVMRPRQEITALNTAAGLAECLELAEKTRYSRFPLCENGDLDRTLGVVHIKDLYARRLRARNGADLVEVARPLIYVPETARLEKLLSLLLERKLHLAIVVDEYGGTVGMVTLENILEALVGQIQDEFDQEKPLLVKTGDRCWELLGALPLHQLAELVGEPLEAGGITTVSGWVTHKLGGFPQTGDFVAIGAYDLKVEELDGTRVASLKLTRRPEAAAAAGV